MLEIDSRLDSPLLAISGALGDIGRAIALALARAGADVAACDLEEGADELRSAVEALGRRFYYGRADVSDAGAVNAWYEAVRAHFGRAPNLIVPNAAVVTVKPWLELSVAQWQREIGVNLSGALYFARAGVEPLVASRRPGRVVLIGSWAAHAPHRHLPAYSVTKAGLRMLCKTLALELAEHRILVNEIAPGYVDGGLSGKIYREKPEVKARSLRGVPLHELLTPEETAEQALFLCSRYARQTTGTTLLQDGGLSLLQGPLTLPDS